jgi:dTDP-4-amino-4,6-dideoxygalactose transaminase
VPIHLQEAYRSRGQGPGSFPVAEKLAGRVLSLPMYPELRQDQIERVADAVWDVAFSSGWLALQSSATTT